eukprot:CAMPEP_0117004872 /NCGR_PEP_ID=MMETSP0472-20121206/5692_1 /TAXON_ID=693140 ORGANISM="Tiarina fusus, Strain LIS" /NCGR_SAMPLE_ID=MMETSP0472 /ASSEMBLY_ACC=CAM_ASM_000603 /LENGTH=251 /DNA_ID=CAMNT_0004705955 /DNA_START=571 /DNA_END=1323 /DNA_ORIENTATION=+
MDPNTSQTGILSKAKNLFATWVVHPEEKRIEFLLQIDMKQVEQLVKEGRASTFEKLALLLIVKNFAAEKLANQDLLQSTYSRHCVKLSASAKISHPQGFVSVTLYDYQLHALAWMRNLEADIYEKKSFTFSSVVKIPGTQDLFMDVSPKQVLPDAEEPWSRRENNFVHTEKWNFHLKDHSVSPISFSLRGGIMADEMGLGKTISMLSLILSNPRQPSELNPNEFEKNHNGNVLYEIKGTLVVCAPHLVAQW